MTRLPVLSVVGPGRVGWALARAAHAAGYTVASIAGGRQEMRERLAAAVGAEAVEDPEAVAGDLAILAVRDAALSGLAAAIRPRGDVYLVHTSGALPAAALGVAGAGTFHPLRSFVGEPRDVDLAGYAVAVEADDEVLGSHLARLADDLKMLPLGIAPADRARYHAAAVLAGNAPIALLRLAQQQLVAVGVPPEVAERAMVRLFRSVARNAEERGAREALSGPVRRGDVATVERHVHALAQNDRAALEVYVALGMATLDLARELPDGPDGSAQDALRSILESALAT